MPRGQKKRKLAAVPEQAGRTEWRVLLPDGTAELYHSLVDACRAQDIANRDFKRPLVSGPKAQASLGQGDREVLAVRQGTLRDDVLCPWELGRRP